VLILGIFKFFLVFVFGGEARLILRPLRFIRQVLYHLSLTPALFSFGYFEVRFPIYALPAWTAIYASHIAG
jgi:hypothetical protein